MAAGPGGAADDDGRSGAEGHRPELFPAVLGLKRVSVVRLAFSASADEAME